MSGLTEEDKKILLNLKELYSGNSTDDHFFQYWDWQKDTSDVDDYFKSYLNSKGFERILNNQNKWWEKRHPYRKWYSDSDRGTRKWFEIAKSKTPYIYTHGSYLDLSMNTNDPKSNTNVVQVGRKPYKSDVNSFDFVLGHEYAHGVSPRSWGRISIFDPKSAQYEALNQNQNILENKHDEYSYEKHADIWGLKYLLYKEGIYDSRSDKDITIDKIKKLREKYPDLRPLQQMNDEQLMFMLNNVAMNENEQNSINNSYT